VSFITFEGGEGVGKTTLIGSLCDHFEKMGIPYIATREPGGSSLGPVIRDLVLHTKAHINPRSELLLYLADRAQHVEEVIKPALAEKKIVLCDRFTDSSLAYQGAGRDLTPNQIFSICQFGAQDLVPDLTFFLDLDPEVGLKRIDKKIYDRIEDAGVNFHKEVYKGFKELAQTHPNRIVTIDASLPANEVLAKVLESF